MRSEPPKGRASPLMGRGAERSEAERGGLRTGGTTRKFYPVSPSQALRASSPPRWGSQFPLGRASSGTPARNGGQCPSLFPVGKSDNGCPLSCAYLYKLYCNTLLFKSAPTKTDKFSSALAALAIQSAQCYTEQKRSEGGIPCGRKDPMSFLR